MVKLIDSTLSSTRARLGLHPVALEDIGLVAAIEVHLGHTAKRANLRITSELEAVDPFVDRARGKAVYRVLQESITNVVRHAQATEVTVRLGIVSDDLILEVIDNGRGFDAELLDHQYIIRPVGMRERATIFDGALASKICSLAEHEYIAAPAAGQAPPVAGA